jgi:hypothetical protein
MHGVRQRAVLWSMRTPDFILETVHSVLLDLLTDFYWTPPLVSDALSLQGHAESQDLPYQRISGSLTVCTPRACRTAVHFGETDL